MNKFILDATCGGKMMWFSKNHPNAIYTDIRKEDIDCCDERTVRIDPDIIMNFTKLEFQDNSFKLVVFDPPHLNKVGNNAYMAQKYGKLLPSWETDIKGGFDECLRVLEPFGILIFKWNETQISINKILNVLKYAPLFGHRSGKHLKTHWMAFMKLNNKEV